MHTILYRTISCLAGACLLSACMTWQGTSNDPTQLIATRTPDRVRVETTDGRTLFIAQPVTVNDTLAGSEIVGDQTETVQIALADVDNVAVRRVNVPQTILLSLAGAAVASFVVFMATFDCCLSGLQFQ